jgi:hypothetical protein
MGSGAVTGYNGFLSHCVDTYKPLEASLGDQRELLGCD